MELFNRIKDMRAEAFKAGDKFLHSVLTNVFSDANPVGAAATANQAPADESVIAVVKKHLKGVVETIEALAKQEYEADVIALKNREKQILEALLPKQLQESDLHAIFNEIMPAKIKDFMAHLNSKYAGLFDGKLAKKVFDTARETQIAAHESVQAENTTPAPVAVPNVAPTVSATTDVAATTDAAPSSTEPTQAAPENTQPTTDAVATK